MRENTNAAYKASCDDFVRMADMLSLSFMQKIESSTNLYYSVSHVFDMLSVNESTLSKFLTCET